MQTYYKTTIIFSKITIICLPNLTSCFIQNNDYNLVSVLTDKKDACWVKCRKLLAGGGLAYGGLASAIISDILHIAIHTFHTSDTMHSHISHINESIIRKLGIHIYDFVGSASSTKSMLRLNHEMIPLLIQSCWSSHVGTA